MKTLQTTSIVEDTSDGTFIIAINDKIVEPSASRERAEQIIASRKGQGWSAYREERDLDGSLFRATLTIMT